MCFNHLPLVNIRGQNNKNMSDSAQSIEILNQLIKKLKISSNEKIGDVSTEISSFINGNIIEHDIPETFFSELNKGIEDSASSLNFITAVAHISNEANLSPSIEPYVVATVPSICSKSGDKIKEIQGVAALALVALVKAINPVAVKVILSHLTDCLRNTTKWQEKVAILNAISTLVDAAKQQVALRMPELIPILSETMWDTKGKLKKLQL